MGQINASIVSVGSPAQAISPARGREGRQPRQRPAAKPKTPAAETESAVAEEAVPELPPESDESHLDVKG